MEKILLLFFVLATAAIFIFLIEGRYILKYIPLEVQGLKSIGFIESIKGNAFRKLKNDSLHLPLSKKAFVYEDDLIITDDASNLKISLLEGKKNSNFLVQEPNTILRLSHEGGTLLIQLKSGAVSTNFSSDTKIKVQLGTLTQDLQIRKGTYFINNSSMGIQITAFDSNIEIKKSLSYNEEQRSAYRVKKNEEENSKSELKNHETFVDEKKPMQFKMPLNLPYPAHRQVFLISSNEHKRLNLVAKSACEGDCNLLIFCGQNILSKIVFKSGEIPWFGLELRKGLPCSDYSWKFIDQKTNFEQSFVIKDYTNEVFQSSLEQGLSIELL